MAKIPINLHIGGNKEALTIYSYRNGGQAVKIVTSNKSKEIEAAILKELESEIKNGLAFFKNLK